MMHRRKPYDRQFLAIILHVSWSGKQPQEQFCHPKLSLEGASYHPRVIDLHLDFWICKCRKGLPKILLIQKNVRNPNHHYFSKKYRNTPSNLYCNTPPIYIAVLLVPLRAEEREILSLLLPFVSEYAPHLYCNRPPICIAMLL